MNASNRVFGGGDPCPGRKKALAIEALCSSFFSMNVSLPLGVAEAEVGRG